MIITGTEKQVVGKSLKASNENSILVNNYNHFCLAGHVIVIHHYFND